LAASSGAIQEDVMSRLRHVVVALAVLLATASSANANDPAEASAAIRSGG